MMKCQADKSQQAKMILSSQQATLEKKKAANEFFVVGRFAVVATSRCCFEESYRY